MRFFLIGSFLSVILAAIVHSEEQSPAQNVDLALKSSDSMLLERTLDEIYFNHEVSEDVVKALQFVLVDKHSSSTRLLAIKCLGRSKSAEAARILSAEMTRSGPQSQSVLLALQAIGLRDKNTCAAILPLLKSSNPDTLAEAVRTLKSCGTSESIDALIEVYKNKNPVIRAEVLNSLKEIGDYRPSVLALFRQGLWDDAILVSLAAMDGLESTANISATIPLLLDVSSLSDHQRSILAENALKKIMKSRKECLQLLCSMLAKDSVSIEQRIVALKILDTVSTPSRDVIAAVITCFQSNNDRLKARAVKTLASYGTISVSMLVSSLDTSPSPETRLYSLKALGEIGVFAQAASERVVSIIQGVQPQPLKLQAIRTLGRIDKSGLHACGVLTKVLLEERDMFLRIAAAEALAGLETIDEVAFGALIEALQNIDGRLRAAAAAGLGSSKAPLKSVIDEISLCLGDGFSGVRLGGLKSVQRLGAEAVPLLPKLMELYVDLDEGVRQEAAVASVRVGLQCNQLNNVLAQVHASQDVKVHKAAITELQFASRDVLPERAVLEPFMENRDPDVRGIVLKLLVYYGQDSLPVIVRALEDQSSAIRSQSLLQLRNIKGSLFSACNDFCIVLKGENRQAQEMILGLIRHEKDAPEKLLNTIAQIICAPQTVDDIRRQAWFTLKYLGPKAKPLTPFLVSQLTASPETETVANILSGFGATASDKLLPLLDHPSEQVRLRALCVLTKIGPDAANASEKVITILKSKDIKLVKASEEVLKSIGKPCVHELAKNLLQDDPVASRSILRILTYLGPRATEAIDSVAALSQSEMRGEVFETLGAMGAVALPYLQRELKRGDPKALREIALAMGRISDFGETPEEIMQLLSSTDPQMRIIALVVLRKANKHRPSDILSVSNALNDPEHIIQEMAAEWLQHRKESVDPPTLNKAREILALRAISIYLRVQRRFYTASRELTGEPEYAKTFETLFSLDVPDGTELYAKHFIDAGQKRKAYHGYYFKILLSQGDAAQGGAMQYVENGKMTHGHALLAYPEFADEANPRQMMVVTSAGEIYTKNVNSNNFGLPDSFNPTAEWLKLKTLSSFSGAFELRVKNE